MGQYIIDQFRGVKDENLCTASSCRQSQLRNFQHFYYKKNENYFIDVSREKRLKHVPKTSFAE